MRFLFDNLPSVAEKNNQKNMIKCEEDINGEGNKKEEKSENINVERDVWFHLKDKLGLED